MSTLDHTLELETTAVRRMEAITGPGRRGRFSRDDKAQMVEETLVPGAVVSEVGPPSRDLADVITRIVNSHPNSPIDELLPSAHPASPALREVA